MPTLERTWTNSQNNVPADEATIEKQGANVLLAMKNAFVSAGWTVTQSSNGLTTSASDLWSVYTDVVHGAAAVVHSWIVLESPTDYPSTGNQVYFAIEWNTSNDYGCFFYLATGDWTGGTTSSIGAAGGNKVTWTKDGEGFVPTILSPIKYHLSYNTTGDVIFYISQNSTGRVGFGLIINKLDGADPSDDYPLYSYIGAESNPTWSQPACGYQSFCFSNMSANGSKGFWIDGTVLSSGTSKVYTLDSNFVSYASGGDSNGSDIDGKFPAVPIFMVNSGVGQRSYRGRVVDIWVANIGGTGYVPMSTVEPLVGAVNLACILDIWFPATVVPSL
jgi:hypothetical protein